MGASIRHPKVCYIKSNKIPRMSQQTSPSLSYESKNNPIPFQLSEEPNTGPNSPEPSVYQIALKKKTMQLIVSLNASI